MKTLFDNITDSEYSVLMKILEHPNSTPSDFLFNDPTIDGRIEELLAHNLISLDSDGVMSITEIGRAALVEHDLQIKQKKAAHRFQLIQFWIPTAISLIALIVSIISLAAQFQAG